MVEPQHPPVDVTKIAAHLQPGAGGIWVSPNEAQISYPEEGNQNCLSLEEDSFWFEHRSRCILAVMRRFPPGGFVLDVGGGNGYVARDVQAAGYTPVLLEPGEVGARMAKQRGIETVICSTLQDARFLPASVPAAGLFDVLEHMQQDVGFLRELKQVLIPGGRLYLTVPAYPLLWSADDDYAGHIRRYTLRSLSRALESAEMKVEYATYFFFMLPLPIFAARVIPTRLGLRKASAWNSYRSEHSTRKGLVGGVLNRLLDIELSQIVEGKKIMLGGSCLVVARKV